MLVPSFRQSYLVTTIVALSFLSVLTSHADPSKPLSLSITQENSDPLTPQQKTRAEQLTSLFENRSLKLQYSYVESLGDGRGITAGRAGFTSGTGDLLAVVLRYVTQQPQSPLARYLPRLEKLAAANSASTTGLGGFESAWKQAAADPIFRQIQDQQVDEDDYQPAVDAWNTLGLKTPLSLAVFYDTLLQNGNDDDDDGFPALVARTTAAVGGTPADGIPEKQWLRTFLDERHKTLDDSADAETRAVWKVSVGRCAVFEQLLEAGNLDLAGPILLHSGGYNETIP